MKTLQKMPSGTMVMARVVGGVLLWIVTGVLPIDVSVEVHCTLEVYAPSRQVHLIHDPSPVFRQPVFGSHDYLESGAFASVLDAHNAFLSQIAGWRRSLALYAAPLAELVKTFPGTEHLAEEDVRAILRSRLGLPHEHTEEDVFKPWTNRWAGRWGNGTSQYHIWDQTRRWQGQWIQPVVQSEVAFPDEGRLEAMLMSSNVDLAINVYSEQHGITGWVSKRQHGRLEIPCLGYLLESTALFWVCNLSGTIPDDIENSVWFTYLETVDASRAPHDYHVHGQSIELNGGVDWDITARAAHTGHYRAR